jgi:hypothetical protein
MENRCELRFEVNQGVTLRVLGVSPEPIIQASVLDVSANGMRLRSGLPVARGTLVEVGLARTIAQGVVSRCQPAQDSAQDTFVLGVQVSAITP